MRPAGSLTAASAARDQFGHEELGSENEGSGSGRDRGARFGCRRVHIVAIRDITPIPHNGCRPPKRRRV